MFGKLFRDTIKEICKYEEEVLFNTEAEAYWYEIQFKNNKLEVLEINEYRLFDSENEWGAIECKTNENKIYSTECTIENFANFVITFLDKDREYKRYSYPQECYILEKIEIRRIFNEL